MIRAKSLNGDLRLSFIEEESRSKLLEPPRVDSVTELVEGGEESRDHFLRERVGFGSAVSAERLK